ncbi:MAG: major facilitator superfamily [Caulobacteraceae bacterium]|nr:major facilitator superfamily [Caulobacteraceae bacterium]
MTDYLRRGTPAFRRASIALFACGFATFALLYCVQPLLPEFTSEFGVSPAASSLAVSAATLGVAVSLIVVGVLSDRLGRKPLMALSQLLVVACTLGVAFAPSWNALLVLRFASGVALSGVPAVAMAYLAEEIEPESLGAVMGLYIAGNAMGGMAGRLLSGILADVTGSWRWAVGIIGVIGLVAALVFIRFLPPSRRFEPAPSGRVMHHVRSIRALFRESTLPWIFACGFLLMGGFVALFNVVAYRLTAAPFNLSNGMVGAISLVYLVGAPVSAAFGGLSDKYGRGRILAVAVTMMLAGLLLTLPDTLFLIVPGLAMVTGGFFGAHAMASAWAGSRVPTARGQAASVYLFFYYLGPGLFGALAGRLWTLHGWWGAVGLIGGMQLLLLVIVMVSPLRKAG